MQEFDIYLRALIEAEQNQTNAACNLFVVVFVLPCSVAHVYVFFCVGFPLTGGVNSYLVMVFARSIYFRFIVLVSFFVLALTDNATAGFRRDPEGAGRVDEIKTPRSL